MEMNTKYFVSHLSHSRSGLNSCSILTARILTDFALRYTEVVCAHEGGVQQRHRKEENEEEKPKKKSVETKRGEQRGNGKEQRGKWKENRKSKMRRPRGRKKPRTGRTRIERKRGERRKEEGIDWNENQLHNVS